MHPFNEYDLIIFDCDGVILDSNQLKIDAMKNALIDAGCSNDEVNNCSHFFASNFGKSRFYHIDYFIENFIDMGGKDDDKTRDILLESFSNQCCELYLQASEADGVSTVFKRSNAIKCVASGSEQNELQKIFLQRELSQYFTLILGSPTKKVDLVRNILSETTYSRAVLIGDAVSDLESAKSNNIDFIYYSPLSNVDSKMRELCSNQGYRVLDSFQEVLAEI
jgi:phosphoglycolate phosphatase-like HAD superfamily hydrolase